MSAPSDNPMAVVGREEPDGVVSPKPSLKKTNGGYRVWGGNTCCRPGTDGHSPGLIRLLFAVLPPVIATSAAYSDFPSCHTDKGLILCN